MIARSLHGTVGNDLLFAGHQNGARAAGMLAHPSIFMLFLDHVGLQPLPPRAPSLTFAKPAANDFDWDRITGQITDLIAPGARPV